MVGDRRGVGFMTNKYFTTLNRDEGEIIPFYKVNTIKVEKRYDDFGEMRLKINISNRARSIIVTVEDYENYLGWLNKR